MGTHFRMLSISDASPAPPGLGFIGILHTLKKLRICHMMFQDVAYQRHRETVGHRASRASPRIHDTSAWSSARLSSHSCKSLTLHIARKHLFDYGTLACADLFKRGTSFHQGTLACNKGSLERSTRPAACFTLVQLYAEFENCDRLRAWPLHARG